MCYMIPFLTCTISEAIHIALGHDVKNVHGLKKKKACMP